MNPSKPKSNTKSMKWTSMV